MNDHDFDIAEESALTRKTNLPKSKSKRARGRNAARKKGEKAHEKRGDKQDSARSPKTSNGSNNKRRRNQKDKHRQKHHSDSDYKNNESSKKYEKTFKKKSPEPQAPVNTQFGNQFDMNGVDPANQNQMFMGGVNNNPFLYSQMPGVQPILSMNPGGLQFPGMPQVLPGNQPNQPFIANNLFQGVQFPQQGWPVPNLVNVGNNPPTTAEMMAGAAFAARPMGNPNDPMSADIPRPGMMQPTISNSSALSSPESMPLIHPINVSDIFTQGWSNGAPCRPAPPVFSTYQDLPQPAGWSPRLRPSPKYDQIELLQNSKCTKRVFSQQMFPTQLEIDPNLNFAGTIQDLRLQVHKLQQEVEQLKLEKNNLLAENQRLAQASQGHQV